MKKKSPATNNKSSPSKAPININAVEIGSKSSKKSTLPPIQIPKKNGEANSGEQLASIKSSVPVKSPPQRNAKSVKKVAPKVMSLPEPKKEPTFKEKRQKRIAQSKLEEEKNKKLYENIVKEYQEKGKTTKIKTIQTEETILSEINKKPESTINMNEEKTMKILKEGGVLDAYQSLVVELCKNGLPIGSLFEFSADYVQSYEKKWKIKKSKENKKELDEYWNEKKKVLEEWEKQKSERPGENKNNKIESEEEKKMKILEKNCNEREFNHFIQSLDKSRATIKKKEVIKNNINKVKNEEIRNKSGKTQEIVEQKDETNSQGKGNKNLGEKNNNGQNNKNKSQISLEDPKNSKEAKAKSPSSISNAEQKNVKKKK